MGTCLPLFVRSRKYSVVMNMVYDGYSLANFGIDGTCLTTFDVGHNEDLNPIAVI